MPFDSCAASSCVHLRKQCLQAQLQCQDVKVWNIVNVYSKAILVLTVSIDDRSISKSNGHKKLDAKFTDVTKCSCMVNLRMSFACNWHRAQKLPGLNLYPEALEGL